MTNEVQLKYNPFDFLNAVSDPELFIGRENQLKDIEYYMEQSRLAPRPFNLAIIGDRGSGKTSLLNMAARAGDRVGFCVVRIDLNEGDVRSPLTFLFKVFDSILGAAVRYKKSDGTFPFEGRLGSVYSTYLDVVTAFGIPEPLERTFIFPIQYAMAMKAGQIGAQISETAFKADLDLIHSEIKAPIALLFDECNVLADKRSELQLLRNIFMNQTGYMLVFSGTSAIFPLMNEVFSPIARQFKKIQLLPFADKNETKRAITVPFRKAGLEPGASSLPRISEQALEDIHLLTGGRPHEIQLVCHYLAKRIQEGMQAEVRLDVNCLDGVLLELRKGVDITTRHVIKTIRDLDTRAISELAVYMQAADATMEQYIFVEAAFSKTNSLKPSDKSLKRGLDLALFRIDDGKIIFQGDDFDKIYCRYYASWRGAEMYFNFLPAEEYLRTRLDEYLENEIKLAYLFSSDPDEPVVVMSPTEGEDEGSLSEDENTDRRVVDNPIVLRRLFFLDFEAIHCGIKELPDVSVYAEGKGLRVAEVFVPRDIGSFSYSEAESALLALKERVASLGGRLRFHKGEMKGDSSEHILKIAERIARQKESADHDEFYFRFQEVYTRRHDIPLTLAYADLLAHHAADETGGNLNNLGYFYMATGNLTKAAEMLERADQSTRQEKGHGDINLINYNLATLCLLQQRFEESRRYLEAAKERNIGAERAKCLLVPHIANRAVLLKEEWDPKFEAAFKGLEVALRRIAEGTIMNAGTIGIDLTGGSRSLTRTGVRE